MGDIFIGVKDISNEEYHATKALGSSDIKAVQRSLAHFKAKVLDKKIEREEKPSFDFGTCAHDVVLEQTTERFIKGPDVSRATKEWKSFEFANSDKIVLKPDDYDGIHQLFNNFADHPVAPNLLRGAEVEKSIFYIDPETELWLKARPDAWVKDDKNGDYIFDYKTTRDASPLGFSKAIFNYGYDISAAHYIALTQAISGREIKNYFFVVQENSAPYEVNIFAASPEMIQRAEKKRRQLLNKISVAMKTNKWPGYSTEILPIDIPYWAANEREGDDESIFTNIA